MPKSFVDLKGLENWTYKQIETFVNWWNRLQYIQKHITALCPYLMRVVYLCMGHQYKIWTVYQIMNILKHYIFSGNYKESSSCLMSIWISFSWIFYHISCYSNPLFYPSMIFIIFMVFFQASMLSYNFMCNSICFYFQR